MLTVYNPYIIVPIHKYYTSVYVSNLTSLLSGRYIPY